jgi:hypothetical protein
VIRALRIKAGGLSLGLMMGAATLGLGLAAMPASALAAGAAVSAAKDLDKIVLRSGKVIEGEILSETAEEIRFNVIVAGISAPATFKKSQIIEIVRGARGDADPADAPEGSPIDIDDRFAPDDGAGALASIDAPKVYVINLKGEFGKEISITPIRDAVKAAEKEQPDFLIVHLDNEWSYTGGEIPDEVQDNFDWFSVADKIEPVFTKEIDLEWEKKPHVVFWVGNAMGGAAFLPFLADEMYFEPDGRIGGIGTLEQMFEGVGDEVVRQKQRSLRLARAQGLAIANGYDYRFINALAQRSYVLSYDIYGTLYERMPENPNEFVLTDDGKDERRDTMDQLVRGTGNDVLTLKADTALKLGMSSGTAATIDELLEQLGILRNHTMVEGRSDQIFSTWARNVSQAQRRVGRLLRDAGQVQGGGTLREQRQAISRQISILEEVQGLFRRYGESFDPFGEGMGQIANLDLRIEQLRIQLLLLRD